MNSEDLYASGDVVVRNSEGLVLRTETLMWDNGKEKLLTEDFVTITRANGDVIRGYGLEADRNLERAVIKRLVRGEFHAR